MATTCCASAAMEIRGYTREVAAMESVIKDYIASSSTHATYLWFVQATDHRSDDCTMVVMGRGWEEGQIRIEFEQFLCTWVHVRASRGCNILNVCDQCSANLNSLSDGLVKKGWVDLPIYSNWLLSFKRRGQLVCKISMFVVILISNDFENSAF